MALRLITPPTVAPLSLDEVKQHLRVDRSDTDGLISTYIDAATSYVEGEFGLLGRALVTQTWELVIDAFPTDEIRIPLPPLQGITSIKYDDTAGDEQTLATSEYTVDTVSEPGWIVPVSSGSWPTTFDGINAVRIQFLAGYAPSAGSPTDLTGNIPRAIKQAMLLLIGSFHEHREQDIVGMAATQLPFASENLLRPYRVVIPFA